MIALVLNHDCFMGFSDLDHTIKTADKPLPADFQYLWDLLYEQPGRSTVGLPLPSGLEPGRPFPSFSPGFCLVPTLLASCGLPFAGPAPLRLHLLRLPRSLSDLLARSQGRPFHGRGTLSSHVPCCLAAACVEHHQPLNRGV